MKAIATLVLRPILCLVIGLTAHLHAASVYDLEGQWVLDGAATWEGFKNQPQVKAMDPEQQKKQESLFLDPARQTTITIFGNKITQSTERETRSMTFTVTKIDGDLITIEATADDGKKQINTLLAKDDVLKMTHQQEPDMVWISRRKPAPIFFETISWMKLKSNEDKLGGYDKPSSWTLISQHLTKTGFYPYDRDKDTIVACDVIYFSKKPGATIYFYRMQPINRIYRLQPAAPAVTQDNRLHVLAPQDTKRVLFSEHFQTTNPMTQCAALGLPLMPDKADHKIFFTPDWDGKVSIKYLDTELTLTANRIHSTTR